MNLNNKVSTYFNNTMTKLEPLIKALNKASPFLEVFNAFVGLFFKKGKRK